ncbi:MAG: anaerobic ribonucleoside-triphosphate reductase activating protein [Candidatus Diapherotrites archaeon]
MNIAGLLKTSLLDYPNHISCVVFTQGCNLRCPFCHNPELIPFENSELMPEASFFDFLEKRKNVLEGVVITGGEPLIQNDLKKFISKIKKMKFKVKLDTNGCMPEKLKELIDDGYVDYIAMDIKAPFERYAKLTGAEVDTDKIKKSIEIIMHSRIDYEFRTTVYPELTQTDFKEIRQMIQGANKYFLQQFRNEKTFSIEAMEKEPYTKEQLEEIKELIVKYVKHVEIRGL